MRTISVLVALTIVRATPTDNTHLLVAYHSETNRTAALAVYVAYVGGSVLFVARKMRTWSARY